MALWMESYGFGTFQIRRWRFGMRWTAKHASSLQLTFARMGSMPSLAPMMADASFMTRRYPADRTGFVVSPSSGFLFFVITVFSPVVTYFSVCALISV